MASMRFSAVSASTIMARRHRMPTVGSNEYQLLFLKRSENTYAGGSYAFPGGKVEPQDYRENWQSNTPQFF